jgi:hypothetical protein
LAIASGCVSGGLPAGNRNGGSFNNQGSNGNWWSASENNATNAWNRNLNNGNANLNENNNNKSNNGFSLRCQQDCRSGDGTPPLPLLFGPCFCRLLSLRPVASLCFFCSFSNMS